MKQFLSPRSLRNLALLALSLSLGGALLAQQADRRLVVNGKSTSVSVRRIEGHTYVDLESLAQATNGTVSFQQDQIVLTIPGSGAARSGAAGAGTASAAPPVNQQHLTKDFASAANFAVSDIREWKGALTTMVIYGMAVDSSWATEYHNRVLAGVTQATVAASTEADHSALQLLNNQFANISNWANNVVSERQALNGARTVDPGSLATDQTLQRITDCDRFLNTMLVSGAFSDNAACH